MSHASVFRALAHCVRTLSLVVVDLVRLASLAAHSRSALAAENLFATGDVPGAEGQATAGRRCHPMDDGDPEPNVPVG
jgi:hypothetical protein